MNIKIDCVNEYNGWNVDFEEVKKRAKSVFEYLLNQPEIYDKCCLKNYKYNTVSFDFLFTDGEKTHSINKEYRNKNYAADIITFAVFADSTEEEKFILDDEINLGEIIIALDKMTESAKKKEIPKEEELTFFISHGIMHLLGFDHQTERDYNFVIKWQKEALKSININYVKI